MIDGVAPTISVAINDGSDGFLNAAEDGSVTIDGTTSGAEDGQTVSISITDGTNTVNTSATVNSNSYSVTGLDLSSLNDGTLTIKADVSDLADNAASQATDTTTKDATAPQTSPAFAAAVTNPFGITDVIGSFRNTFADADNDRDLDLFRLRNSSTPPSPLPPLMAWSSTAPMSSTAPTRCHRHHCFLLRSRLCRHSPAQGTTSHSSLQLETGASSTLTFATRKRRS